MNEFKMVVRWVVGGLVLGLMAWVIWAFKVWIVSGIIAFAVTHTLVWQVLGKDLFHFKAWVARQDDK